MTNLITILFCLSSLESGHNDFAIGKHGERSRYQITEATWRHYTSLPFDCASDSVVAHNVAKRILEYRIARFIKRKRRQPTPQEIYRLWNPGANKATCERFENLVNDQTKVEGKK